MKFYFVKYKNNNHRNFSEFLIYNFVNEINFFNFNFISKNSFNNYKNIIKFKNSNGVFKNENFLGKYLSNKIWYSNKKYHNYNTFYKKNNYNLIKNFDSSKKFYPLFKKNLFFLNFILNKKIIKNNKFKVFIKNFLKKSFSSYFNNYNYNLSNILIKNKIFSNYEDFFFFLKNNFIFLNKKIIKKNQILNEFDIINISFNKFYYFFYKNQCKKYINFFLKFSKRYWLFTKTKNIFKKKMIEINPLWTLKLLEYNNEILKFVEIDFLSMTIIFIYKYNNYFNINYFNNNYINFYLSRLYVWKIYN